MRLSSKPDLSLILSRKSKKPMFIGFIGAESVGFEPTCPIKDNCISSALLSMDFTGIYLILAGFDGS